MYQGTTHLLTLEVEDKDLSEMVSVEVSIRTLTGKLIEKRKSDLVIGGNEIAILLTQEETLALPEGPLRCQVRWLDSSGNAGVTETGYVDVVGIQTNNVIARDEA